MGSLRNLIAKNTQVYFNTYFLPFKSDPTAFPDKRMRVYVDKCELLQFPAVLIDNDGDEVELPFVLSKHEAQEFIRQFHKLMDENNWSEE